MNTATLFLRSCTYQDWDFVIGVTGACMRAYAEQTWGQWNPETRESFTPDTHAIVQYRGEDVGCMEVIEEPEALFLSKLYIGPDHQNKGLGGVLIGQLIEKARCRKVPIKLQVLSVNPARRFYERHGFKVTASTAERHFMEWREG